MILSGTHYRLILPEDESKLFNWLLEETGVPNGIGWPTVIAERNDETIGCIVTQPREDAVVCGPLVAKNPIILYRLVLFYENIMDHLGISEYLFSVDDPETSPVVRALAARHMPLRDLGQSQGQHWYARRVA